MKIGKQNSFWLAGLFSVFAFIISFNEAEANFSVSIFLSSYLIQTISFFAIFSNNQKPYSLFKIYYLFCLFFYGFAPLFQFYENSAFWGGRKLLEREYFIMNIIIITIMLLYWIFYSFFYKLPIRRTLIRFERKLRVKPKKSIRNNVILISLSAFSFFAVFYVNNFNVLSMLIRGGEFKETANESGSVLLIVLKFFLPLSVISFLAYFTLAKKNIFILILLISFMLLAANPIGMSRNAAAGLYIPVFIICFSIFSRKNFFILSFISGLLIVFPFLNQFRNFSESTKLQIKPNFQMFTEGHFDSYYNFSLIVNENVITHGNQLLGVLFFWIPRSYWSNKPLGSGAFISENFNFYFSNISANFFAEGYINFGFLGVFLFLIFLSAICAQMDKIYWDFGGYKKNDFFKITYLVFLGMLFFMLRGDLMSSFAYTLGFLLAIGMVYKFISKNSFYSI